MVEMHGVKLQPYIQLWLFVVCHTFFGSDMHTAQANYVCMFISDLDDTSPGLANDLTLITLLTQFSQRTQIS